MFKKYVGPLFKCIGFFIIFWTLNNVLLKVADKVFHYQNIVFLGLMTFIAAIITTYIFLKGDKKNLEFIELKLKKPWDRKLLKGICLGSLVTVILIFTLLILGLVKFNLSAITTKEVVSNIIIGFVIQLFSVVLVEEILFRGYILHYLNSKYTKAGAIVVSSFLFAFMQISKPYSTPLGVFNAFIFGMVLSIIVFRYKSVWTVIGFHFIWNFIFGIILSSPVRGKENLGVFNLTFKDSELLNGGLYGVEGGIVCTIVLVSTFVYLLIKDLQQGQYVLGTTSKKNKILVGILTLVTIAFVGYDIKVWLPKSQPSDNAPIKQVNKFTNVNDYNMKLQLDVENKRVSGVEEISYINNSKDNLKEVYFHMYANAFKKFNGSIDIKKVKVNGSNKEVRIEGSDKTLLNVPLEKELKPGERVSIALEYNIKIPKSTKDGFADRFGYGENTFNLGNFFPIASVYENGAWDKHVYDKKGDAFYSETSNFDVQISAPKNQIIASCGVVKNIGSEAKNNLWNIQSYGARDFAFVSSDRFKMVEADVDGTKVKAYALNKQKAKKVLNISCDAIKVYNKRFGQYPYATCSVVQSDIGGGMEYPTLVMIGSNGYDNVKFTDMASSFIFGSPIGEMEFTVVHEIAHQWWYGLVGNDEFREAWIDEPLTQMSSLLYYKDNYGKESFDNVYDKSIVLLYKLLEPATSTNNPSLKRSLNEFQEDEYTNLIYNKGTIMFKKLNDKVGDEKFNKFLSTLFEKYKFKVIHGNEFVDLTSEVLGEDMKEFYNKWLETKFVEY